MPHEMASNVKDHRARSAPVHLLVRRQSHQCADLIFLNYRYYIAFEGYCNHLNHLLRMGLHGQSREKCHRVEIYRISHIYIDPSSVFHT